MKSPSDPYGLLPWTIVWTMALDGLLNGNVYGSLGREAFRFLRFCSSELERYFLLTLKRKPYQHEGEATEVRPPARPPKRHIEPYPQIIGGKE